MQVLDQVLKAVVEMDWVPDMDWARVDVVGLWELVRQGHHLDLLVVV